MAVDREQEILEKLHGWSSGELSDYYDLVEAENIFIESFVQGEVFSELLPEMVRHIREEMIRDPRGYLTSILKFFRRVAGQGFPIEDDPSAPIPDEMYVARLLAGGKGYGLNYLFTPGDPSIEDIKVLYAKFTAKLNVDVFPLPFSVFWSDAFYYRGNEITRGDVTSDPHLPTPEFEYWDQTWSMIQTHAAIFRLGAPYIPPNFCEVLQVEVK
jgi:hypothetical protein